MITNERQYKVTKAAARRLREGLDASNRKPSAEVDPRLHAAMQEGIASQLDELDQQLADYERLTKGDVPTRVFSSLSEIAIALIEGRIAAHLSQKDLAQRLKVPEQQIQRDEATNYSSASLRRLQEVADAVGLEIEEHVTYSVHAEN